MKTRGSEWKAGIAGCARRLCMALACGFGCALALAGDMYKWQDADGVWHFSDRPPAAGEAFDTFEVPAEPREMVSLRRVGSEREPTYVFFNHYHGPAELEVHLAEARNVRTEPALPARFVLPGQAERYLVELRAVDARQGFRYRLGYALVPGPPTMALPTDLDFYPPFPAGLAFPISQGLDDSATHSTPDSEFAVDIAMPEGTPVLAARAGVVMDLEDGFHAAGKQQQRYMNRANHVRILHEDGSMAVYAHLQADSARVGPGMRVPVGTWIANSGNTGFSSGPHLHFVVQLNTGMTLTSLPFRFRLRGGRVLSPDRAQMLSGVIPLP